jgi:hypothetical protein
VFWWDHLLMEQGDPEKRIAELERQLAESRADQVVEQPRQFADPALVAVDEHACRLAQAFRDRRGRPPDWSDLAPLRDGLMRAAADAGLSQEQYDGALARAGLKAVGSVKLNGQVAYQGPTPLNPFGIGLQAGFGGQANYRGPTPVRPPGFGGQSRARKRAWLAGTIALVAVPSFYATIGTILIPSSSLWTSGILCSSGYRLAYDRLYSTGSGNSVSFRCVNGEISYDASTFGVIGLQFMLAAIVVLVVGGTGLLASRLLSKGS